MTRGIDPARVVVVGGSHGGGPNLAVVGLRNDQAGSLPEVALSWTRSVCPPPCSRPTMRTPTVRDDGLPYSEHEGRGIPAVAKHP